MQYEVLQGKTKNELHMIFINMKNMYELNKTKALWWIMAKNSRSRKHITIV
jgi:hypothetical protein